MDLFIPLPLCLGGSGVEAGLSEWILALERGSDGSSSLPLKNRGCSQEGDIGGKAPSQG